MRYLGKGYYKEGHVLPLCSEKILEVKGEAGFACPVIGDPMEDWDANGDLGAECCWPCLGLSPFIFDICRGCPPV